MDGRKSYLNLKDMFDGGGMGQAGAKFEGGGLLSMLGNALGIAPYGAARERDLELATNALAGVALKPSIVEPVIRAEEMQYSGRGPSGMPYPQFAQDEMSRRNIDYLRSIGMIDY